MPNSQKIVNLGVTFILVGGIVFRTIWSFYRLEWSYWFSDITFGIFLIFPGIAILLKPQYAVPWLQFVGIRKSKNNNWYKFQPIQKGAYFALAFLEFLVGAIILFLDIYRILSGCLPLENCGGI